MESRDACEIKLTKPLKFVTGRIDCDSSNEVIDCIDADDIEEYELSDAGFVTCKTEVKLQAIYHFYFTACQNEFE